MIGRAGPMGMGLAPRARRRRGVRLLLRSRTALAGGVVVLLLVVTAIFAPQMAPHDPSRQDLRQRLTPPAWQDGGTPRHLLGTDQLGRDILSRLMHGARVSLLVGVTVVVCASTLGTLLGLMAGYFGGYVDAILMRVVDVFLAFPFLLMAVILSATLGPSLGNIILVLAVTGWVEYARVVRGQVLSLREREFVMSAVALGSHDLRILGKHLLPNIAASVIVVGSLQVGTVIVVEASLTFLGLGIPPAIPTWGGMLSIARDYMARAWWLATFPGLAIVITVLAVNFIGDWVRDTLDPTM